MLARHQQPLVTALFIGDGLLVYAAWVAAYALRFSPSLPAPLGVPPPERYLWAGAVVTLAALLIFRSLDLYRSARSAPLSREQITVLEGVALTTAVAGLLSFVLRGELSRLVLALFAVLAGTLLCGSRLAIRSVLRSLRRRGRNLRHVLIVGTGKTAQSLALKMTSHPEFGFLVVGQVASAGAPAVPEGTGTRVVGGVGELPQLVERTGAELVYLALEREDGEAEHQALDLLQDSTATVRLVPDLSRAFVLNAGVEDFDGTPVVLVTESPGQGWNALLKRSFDLILASLALLLLWPVMIVIVIWLKLDSPGPALIEQERVGLNGRRFTLLKFRTMAADAEAGTGPTWSRRDDPRRTRAGQILRRLSLDELPQLFNVLAGQMSLVGPRPERARFVEQFRASVPRYMLRHHVKAGLTGWAQVNGLRGDTALDRRIEYDLYYIRHWSLGFDLRILGLTLLRVFRDESAQ